MPKDAEYYKANQNEYYFKLICQTASLVTLTSFLTYPLDLIHTRMATDMSPRT